MISLILIIIVGIEHLLFGFIEMFGGTKLQADAFGFDESELKIRHCRLRSPIKEFIILVLV